MVDGIINTTIYYLEHLPWTIRTVLIVLLGYVVLLMAQINIEDLWYHSEKPKKTR